MCKSCIKCSEVDEKHEGDKSCRISTCETDAQKIVNAIVASWNLNFGKGNNDSKDNVGGYLCWDWADAFARAATSVNSRCWQVEKASARVTTSTDGQVHHWVELQAGYRKRKREEGADKCTVMFDDGWTREGGYVHSPPWPPSDRFARGNAGRGPATNPPIR
jgi:hypothetical protein